MTNTQKRPAEEPVFSRKRGHHFFTVRDTIKIFFYTVWSRLNLHREGGWGQDMSPVCRFLFVLILRLPELINYFGINRK